MGGIRRLHDSLGLRAFAGIALLTLCALPGCLFARGQVNASDLPDRVSGVVPGTTTIAQVERMIGGPATSITPLGAGNLLHVYTFGDTKTAGLSLIVLNISRTNSGFDTAFFVVDPSGVVVEMKVGQNSKDLEWEWWAFGD
jgi:hypothetical protein